MLHIDLFSGIGGFAYAARQVWPDYHNLFFCDNNKFCQAVLRKNFGQDILIYDDIREVTVERFIADTELRGCSPKMQYNEMAREGTGAYSASNQFTVDLLTGGFPCQPFSVAGKRTGSQDDRYLFPEMLRVIAEFKPSWVIGENVAGIQNIFQYKSTSPLEGKIYNSREDATADLGGILERTGTNELYLVVEKLEGLGYEVQVFIVPACAVNAPHRRDRVWIIAHAERTGAGCECREVADKRWATSEGGREGIRQDNRAAGTGRITATDLHAADAERTEREGKWGNTRGRRAEFGCGDWSRPWFEVATRLCRVDDGLSAIMDGTTISKSKHREERLKALGNSIVPQVAIQLMASIRDVDAN